MLSWVEHEKSFTTSDPDVGSNSQCHSNSTDVRLSFDLQKIELFEQAQFYMYSQIVKLVGFL